MCCRYSFSILLAVSITTACSDEDEPSTATGTALPGPGKTPTPTMNGTPEPPSTPPTNDPPPPLSIEFEGLVEQAAPWAGLDIRVTGARLYRGERPETLTGPVLYFANSVYAVLDVNITPVVNTETDYTERDTWDLIFADGTRERPLNPLGITIVTGDSPTAQLYYSTRDGADTSFVGAALEVNGADRTSREPLRIPLDMPAVFESESELTSLVGQVVEPTGKGELSFEVLAASYGVNLREQKLRAPVDQRLVALNTRVSYSGPFSESFSAVNNGPKLSVNGNTLAAVEGELDTIPSGGSIDFLTIYEIDEAATTFDVVFDTGDEALVRIPVVVPAPPGVVQ